MNNTLASTPATPLAQLRDIHLPDAVGWWPLAPGWWVLAAVIATALVAGGCLLHKRIAGNRYRKAALRELERQFNQYHQHQGQQQLCQQVLEILRRCLLTADSRPGNHSAGQLLQALNGQTGKAPFSEQLITRIDQLAYAPHPAPLDRQQLVNLQQSARQWIKRHRRGKP